MIIYWLMFFVPALAVFILRPHRRSQSNVFLAAITIFYILVVGFRFEVGCDWGSYILKFHKTNYIDGYAGWEFVSKDIGYAFLNIFVRDLGGNVIWVNFIASIVCMLGLNAFARRQPEPLVVYVAAVPYIIIVLFQGYTRQAIAFGFELFALAALGRSQYRRFVVQILLAASFHKTAVVLLPLAALASSKNKWWSYLWIGTTFIAAYYLFVLDAQDALWDVYVTKNMASTGGGIRVAMCVFPSALFLILRNHLPFESEAEKKLWFWISLVSLFCVPLVGISSTAVDRLALYLMPIQLYFFTRLPLIFPDYRKSILLFVVLFYLSVQFVWLNYASHAYCWVPYKSWLFQ